MPQYVSQIYINIDDASSPNEGETLHMLPEIESICKRQKHYSSHLSSLTQTKPRNPQDKVIEITTNCKNSGTKNTSNLFFNQLVQLDCNTCSENYITKIARMFFLFTENKGKKTKQCNYINTNRKNNGAKNTTNLSMKSLLFYLPVLFLNLD